jgi:hypothetical protein
MFLSFFFFPENRKNNNFKTASTLLFPPQESNCRRGAPDRPASLPKTHLPSIDPD